MRCVRVTTTGSKRHDQKAKAVGHAASLVLRAAEVFSILGSDGMRISVQLSHVVSQAAALRCLLVEEMRNNSRPVILIGDLNDVVRSNTYINYRQRSGTGASTVSFFFFCLTRRKVHSVTTEIISGTPPWKRLPRPLKDQIWLVYSTNFQFS